MRTIACPSGQVCERQCAQTCHLSVVEEWVEKSCREQGVPVKVTDPETLDKVATLLWS